LTSLFGQVRKRGFLRKKGKEDKRILGKNRGPGARALNIIEGCRRCFQVCLRHQLVAGKKGGSSGEFLH